MEAHVNLPRCVYCGHPVDPDHNPSQVYQKITGWERKRDAGGTNAVRLRVAMREYACALCIDKQAKGVNAGQGALC